MGSGSVAHLVNRIHRCIYCGVKPNGIFRTRYVQINCARYCNCIDPKGCKLLRALKGAVPANYNNPVDAMLAANLSAQRLAFWRPKLTAPCSL